MPNIRYLVLRCFAVRPLVNERRLRRRLRRLNISSETVRFARAMRPIE